MNNVHMDIRQLLETHAHTKEFFLPRLEYTGSNMPTGTYIGHAKNDFCADSLSILLSVDNERVHLQHFGEYCTLAHASAELFCKNFCKINIQKFTNILIFLQNNIEKNNIIHYNTISDKDYVSLLCYPMSVTRKICMLLPLRASIQAVKYLGED